MPLSAITRKNTLLLIPAILLAAFALLAFRPLPEPAIENCRKQTGTVLKVAAGEGRGDIVISLQNDDHYYYINRGLERGLSISSLAAKLENHRIDLLTVRHWSPLDPASTTRHIARIECDGAEIYTEL